LRPFLTEWGVAEGNLGHWARNVVLAGMSLQDFSVTVKMHVDNIHVSLSCLALSLRNLWKTQRTFAILNGIAGLVEIGSLLPVKIRQSDWIEESDELAFKNGASPPDDAQSAANLLTSACRAAQELVEEPLPAGLPNATFKFNQLLDATRF
jgi:hypothetical protein